MFRRLAGAWAVLRTSWAMVRDGLTHDPADPPPFIEADEPGAAPPTTKERP